MSCGQTTFFAEQTLEATSKQILLNHFCGFSFFPIHTFLFIYKETELGCEIQHNILFSRRNETFCFVIKNFKELLTMYSLYYHISIVPITK
jgi:hypothetical protein